MKAVGGSTMHWGAWALRLKPEDFQLDTNTGEGGDWPITYDDLEDYYFRPRNTFRSAAMKRKTGAPAKNRIRCRRFNGRPRMAS